MPAAGNSIALAILVVACTQADRPPEVARLAIASKPDLVITGKHGKEFNSISGAVVTSDGRVVISDDTPAV